MRTEEGQLEKLCPYERICDGETCPDNYETCEKYKIFKSKTTKLPYGRCWAGDDTFIEKDIHTGKFLRNPGRPHKGQGRKKKK